MLSGGSYDASEEIIVSHEEEESGEDGIIWRER